MQVSAEMCNLMRMCEVTAGSSNSECYKVFKAYTEPLEEYDCAVHTTVL